MGVYEPKVQCRGNFDTAVSCRDVLADMPATTDLEVFGPRDTPFVKEILPQGMYISELVLPIPELLFQTIFRVARRIARAGGS